jgi:hypothetical protein
MGDAPSATADPRFRRTVPALLFLGSVLVYLSNGDLLVVNDAMPGVYAPRILLSAGRLTYAPADAPFMFYWEASNEDRKATVWIPSLDHPMGGRPARAWMAAGKLRPLKPEYFLVPTSGEPARYAGIYGPVPGLVAVPMALVFRFLGGPEAGSSRSLWASAKLTAALLVAGSVLCLYFTALAWVGGPTSTVLAAAYAVGTHVWCVSSQALWQQTPVIFLTSLGFFFLLAGKPGPRSLVLAGLALGAAFAGRATGAIVVGAVGLHLLLGDRKAALAFAVGCLPPVLLILLTGALVHGSPVGVGQVERGAALAEAKCGAPGVWQTPLWLGAAGVLLSPSRGLLVFSPFLAFAFWGLVRSVARPEWRPFRPAAVGTCGLLLVAFKWFDWWGGWSFGYRLVVDVVPLLVLLLIPVARDIGDCRWLRAGALVLTAWSVLVQILGAFFYEQGGWNDRRDGFTVGEQRAATIEEARELARSRGLEPSAVRERRLNVDEPEHRRRLWSIADSQLLHLVGRLSESRAEKRRVSRRTLEVLP